MHLQIVTGQACQYFPSHEEEMKCQACRAKKGQYTPAEAGSPSEQSPPCWPSEVEASCLVRPPPPTATTPAGMARSAEVTLPPLCCGDSQAAKARPSPPTRGKNC